MLNLLSSIGSFLGGLAGILAASAAFIGVNVWKKQLTFGKHISLIWSCMESIRAFQRRKTNWYLIAFAYGTNRLDESESLTLKKAALDGSIEELSTLFNSLDKIVIKNNWMWANYANQIKMTIHKIEQILIDNRENPQHHTSISIQLSAMNGTLNDTVIYLETELDKLEKKYQ